MKGKWDNLCTTWIQHVAHGECLPSPLTIAVIKTKAHIYITYHQGLPLSAPEKALDGSSAMCRWTSPFQGCRTHTVCRDTWLSSPGSTARLETQNLGPYPRPTGSESVLWQDPRAAHLHIKTGEEVLENSSHPRCLLFSDWVAVITGPWLSLKALSLWTHQRNLKFPRARKQPRPRAQTCIF